MPFTHIVDGDDAHQHDTVADARECEDGAAEARAEYLAELAVERFFEYRGYDEHRAFEDWERSRGVVDFPTAYALARGEAVLDPTLVGPPV
jgi:hypothetical protein